MEKTGGKNSLDVVERKKLSDIVCGKVLKYIELNQLKPGDTVPSEKEMMTIYQVGRSVIREAMQTLKHMGLIEVKHGGRSRIVQPSIDEITEKMAHSMSYVIKFSKTSLEDLKNARKFVEIGFVRYAAKKRKKHHIDELKEILNKHRDIIQTSKSSRAKYHDLVKIDSDFHKKIAEISKNQIFETFTNTFFAWISISNLDLDFTPEIEEKTIGQHERIVNAIEAGDADLAEKYMNEHIDLSKLLDIANNFYDAVNE